MKTRLLLFLLVVFSFGNAQVISYNDFESTTVPAGWDYGSFTPNTTEVCNGATTLGVTLSQGAQAEIRSPLYNHTNNLYVLAVNFKKTANIKLSIQYSLDDVTWQNMVESYASTCTELRGNLGLSSIGTVRFRILVLNDSSTPINVSTYIDDFKFAGYEVNYTFNNTRNNSNTFQPFSTANTSFISDRNAVANNALNIAASSTGTSVTLESAYQQLPSGNASRTISFWYKVGANVNNSSIFAYGPAGNNTRFGMFIEGADGRPIFWANLPNQLDGVASFPADTWHHAVLTYDGANIRIYMNGVLHTLRSFAINTTFTPLSFFNASTSLGLDDLKIYRYAITDEQVSNLYHFNQLGDAGLPTISAISPTTTTSSATINYTLSSTNGAATSVINYGLTSTSLTSQTNGFSTNSTNTNSITINSLQPNTTYFYQIVATNSTGTNQSAVLNFRTPPLLGLIYHFPFNGDMTDIINNTSLTSSATQTYETNGITAGNALTINITDNNTSRATAPNANLPLLPIGNQPRTMAMRVNFKTSSGTIEFIAAWGTSTNGQAYGFEHNNSLARIAGWGQELAGFAADFSQTIANNTWYNVVATYNGTSTTLYINGVAIGTKNINLNTTGTNFVLGRSLAPTFGFANYAIDDLRIYNYSLTSQEVSALESTLSSGNFNQSNLEVSLYPNPVNNVLNIETALEIQNVEIYNIQGQKVLSSNQKQINVSDLAAGMYMVRIKDTDNKIATKKIVIK